ncbi:MAG: hypothetical protein KME46_28025 [Brasilonema angustatum HA4187-MV1]|jgi:hypothetical protein|nr:hypothetical protein [Brasilonema angustatum HA4187-MV1]
MSENIKLTIALNEPNLDAEEREEQTRNLLQEVKDRDEVEQASLVGVTETPRGSKAFAGFLVGMLQAEVSVANLKKLLGFLGDRLGDKSIKLTVKAPDGREISLEASSKEEFEFARQQAEEFLKNTNDS